MSSPSFVFRILIFVFLGASGMAQLVNPPEPIPGIDKNQPHPSPGPILDWKTGEGGSYVIPAYEVPGFLAGLSVVDRITIPHDVYDSTWSSTWEHLHEQHWVFDTDPFEINQFAHPYQGSMMFGFARSTGVSFWQSLFYSNVGSFIWKMAGETDLPSINDQLTTGTAGALLGESLFRMASLLLERAGPDPGVWTELGAAVISPPLAFNRLVFGERFKAIFPSYDPAFFQRLRFGVSADANVTENGQKVSDKQEAIADYSLVYGLPGKDGYEYLRPFDYFSFEFAGQTSAHTHNFIQDIFVRGMLYGKDYELGENYRGIVGVFASYDYVSPTIFRISSTAVSFGTTEQWWLTRQIAIQGTALAGLGFAGAGTIPTADGLRDYHYGATPQGLFALRTIFGRRAMLDLTAREYYVSGTGSDDKRGSEQIFRADAGVTVRVFHHQAIGLEFLESNRHGQYVRARDQNASEGKFSLVYTLLGEPGFGAVSWGKNGTPNTD
jgi:hypothetical protein